MSFAIGFLSVLASTAITALIVKLAFTMRRKFVPSLLLILKLTALGSIVYFFGSMGFIAGFTAGLLAVGGIGSWLVLRKEMK